MAELIAMVVSFFNTLINVNSWEDQLYESANVNLSYSNKLAEYNWNRAEQSADNAMARQKQLWNEIQSPTAMYNQFKSLGASEQASLMAALGVGSPSMSAPMASSSSPSTSGSPYGSPLNGDVAQLLNAFQNAANSWYNNQKTVAETDQIRNDIKWQDTLTGKQVEKITFDMDLDLKRYGLDYKIFKDVTLPTAKSLIDLNTQEIKNKQQQWLNLCQEYYNLQAQFHETMAKVRNLDANTELANAQTDYTQGALTDKTIAETGLVQQQTKTEEQETIIKHYEGQIKGLEARVSGVIGVPISLPMPNILYGKSKMHLQNMSDFGSETSKHILSFPDRQFNKIKHGVDVAFKRGLSVLQHSENVRMARKYAIQFMDDHFKDSTQYRRYRFRYIKD